MGVWAKIMLSIAKILISWGSNLLFNYADTDNNGELSKQEITNLISKLKKLLSRK